MPTIKYITNKSTYFVTTINTTMIVDDTRIIDLLNNK
jgi:hypothetical protein